jgi:UDP-GlcNAc3NAcA epimerase
LTGCNFIFPAHPRTRKIIKQQNLEFASHVKMIDPIGYLEMIAYESACSAVLTDSGGVQKEAYFFRKPCITVRDSTEWVELTNSGWNTLTGTDTDKIINTVKNLKIPDEYPSLYGDGNCASKICEILRQYIPLSLE